MEKDKIHNKNNKTAFVASKVRVVAKCDSSAAQRCIYSMKQVDSKSGPTQKDFNSLQQWLENGYLCGAKVYSNPKFVTKRQICCGDQIEPQYYNKDGTRGG